VLFPRCSERYGIWSEIPLGDPAHEEATEIPDGKTEKLKLLRRKGT
jgi:hypothetical protein